MQFVKATRKKVKIKVGLQGPAGSGKSMGALLLAYGLCGDWAKIGYIDTENESASLYVGTSINGLKIGEFQTLPLRPPFTPERFSEAIQAGIQADGIEVIVCDSISHEWMGKGGILDLHEQMGKMNDMQKWAKLTPRHNRFIDDILQAPKHMILCMRSKQDYIMKEGTSSSGKQTVIPEKVGLKAVTKDGVDYEFTLNFDIDINNFATATKDRTSLFKGKPEFKITPAIGEEILAWCESGADSRALVAEAIVAINNCSNVEQLKEIKATLDPVVLNDAEFIKAAKEKFATLPKPINDELFATLRQQVLTGVKQVEVFDAYQLTDQQQAEVNIIKQQQTAGV